MSIFARLFRAPANMARAIREAIPQPTAVELAAAAGAVQLRDPSISPEDVPKVSMPPEPTITDADGFTKRFATKLYLGEHFRIIHGKASAPRAAMACRLMSDWFDTHSVSVDLADMAKEYAALEELQIRLSVGRTLQIFQEQQLGAAVFQSKEAIEKGNAERRNEAGTRKFYLSIRTAELLVPTAEAMRDNFRALTADIDRSERETAEGNGVEFKPSQRLQAMAWISLIGAMMPTEALALRPIADAKAIREYWVEPTSGRKQGKTFQQLEIEAAREREKNLPRLNRDVPDLTPAQKAEQLARINRLNDEVRLMAAPDKASILAEHERRKAAEREQKLSDTQKI